MTQFIHIYFMEQLYDENANEENDRKLIAQREMAQACQNNYEVGYQGALVQTLEEREEKTALSIIKELVEKYKNAYKDEIIQQAKDNLNRFMSGKRA